jgi:hypothetical protein
LQDADGGNAAQAEEDERVADVEDRHSQAAQDHGARRAHRIVTSAVTVSPEPMFSSRRTAALIANM